MSNPNPNVPYGYCQCGCGSKAPISTETHAARGYVKGLPRQFVKGHHRRRRNTPDFKVEDCGYDTPCWVWQLALTTSGYGRLSRDGEIQAHRWHYARAEGPIPEGLELDHLCRNRACCNPDHLEPVTRSVNVRRAPHAVNFDRSGKVLPGTRPRVRVPLDIEEGDGE